MITICTIITADYLPVARVLCASIQKNNPGTGLHVLVIGEHNFSSEQYFTLISLNQLREAEFYKEIEKKYAHTNPDVFRWALKPVLVGYLLQQGYEKVIFADPDLYFVNKFDFLFDLLDSYAVLLTPHWADLDIISSEDSVMSVLRNGLFNAGFVAASQKGLPAIHWWAGMCHYKTEKRSDLGIYDDQKYLDMLPVQFENVHILKHQGCNLASWNIQTCKREMVEGKLLINRQFEPVFIHFAKDTIINILNRNDVLLRPYLDEYISALAENGFNLLKNLDNFSPGKYDTVTYRLKHKLRLRTRLKRFLFKLAEKI
ncbi:MAG: hypothetical protein ACT4OJ_01735 [Bacteroidota bacterium]